MMNKMDNASDVLGSNQQAAQSADNNTEKSEEVTSDKDSGVSDVNTETESNEIDNNKTDGTDTETNNTDDGSNEAKESDDSTMDSNTDASVNEGAEQTEKANTDQSAEETEVIVFDDELKNIYTIYFDPDKYDIKNDYLDILDRVFELSSKTDSVIVIEGNYNGGKNNKPEMFLNLSMNRALVAKTYLISKGVDQSRIEVINNGANKPLSTNSTDNEIMKNRRVDMFFKDYYK